MKLWISKDKIAPAIGVYKYKPEWIKDKVFGVEDWRGCIALCYIDSKEFPELTFENSPQEVKLNLVK
jgi:hypothetical protein